MPEAWDDMNNVVLDPQKIALARQKQMSRGAARQGHLGVYKRVPQSRVRELGGSMVSVKWLDTGKGYLTAPNGRSRLVAHDLNTTIDNTLYASTPPLEALRVIISHAATTDPSAPDQRRGPTMNDVRRVTSMPSSNGTCSSSCLRRTAMPARAKWDS